MTDGTMVLAAERSEDLIRLATDSLGSPHSRRAYTRALRQYLAWHAAEGWPRLSRASVQAWKADQLARGAGPRTINVGLAAIKALAREAVANGYLDEATGHSIKDLDGAKVLGTRTGNWLEHDGARTLLAAANTGTLAGKRDLALLGLLLGCGLRRAEAAGLLVEQVQPRNGRRVIADLVGKGGRVRTVAVPGWCWRAVEDWTAAASLTSGLLLRAVDRYDRLEAGGMSPAAIRQRVGVLAARAGVQVAPHDLRRTFATLALRGGATTRSIQAALGHASQVTTERYLQAALDLKDPACDHLGLGMKEEGEST